MLKLARKGIGELNVLQKKSAGSRLMPRRFTEQKLILASHNPGKAKEIAELLQPFAIEVISAGALGLPEPDETEDSFIGNAKLKALAAVACREAPGVGRTIPASASIRWTARPASTPRAGRGRRRISARPWPAC